jgi:hypothetical protein
LSACHPVGDRIASSRRLSKSSITLRPRIGFPERLFVLQVCNQALLSIRPIGQRRIRIEIHRERVLDRINEDVLIEAIFLDVIAAHAKVAPADRKGMAERLVVGVIGIRIRLDVPEQPGTDLRYLRVGDVIDRMDLDPRPLLLLLVLYFATVRIDLVDGEHGAFLPLNRPCRDHVGEPLLTVPEAKILQAVNAIRAFYFCDVP